MHAQQMLNKSIYFCNYMICPLRGPAFLTQLVAFISNNILKLLFELFVLQSHI